VISAVTTFSACLRRLFGMWLYCCLCVCVPDALVFGMFGCEPPEDGQKIVTETCRVLIDVFYKIF
jgi:hypothetical protein